MTKKQRNIVYRDMLEYIIDKPEITGLVYVLGKIRLGRSIKSFPELQEKQFPRDTPYETVYEERIKALLVAIMCTF